MCKNFILEKISDKVSLKVFNPLFEYYFSERMLYEEKHIITYLEEISTDITNQLIDYIDQFLMGKVNPTEYTAIFTNWCFTSKEDRLEGNFNNVDEIPNFFVKTYNEKLYHPIYFYLKNSESFVVQNTLATINSRVPIDKEKLTESIKAYAKSEKIEILINLQNLGNYDLSTRTARYFISSVIAHELFHAFERFVIRYDDVLSHRKNLLYRDLFKNDLKLNRDDLIFTERLLYYMTPEEQRARLNQLDVFLRKFTEAPAPELWNRLNNNIRAFVNTYGLKSSKRHIAICSVLKLQKIENITMLYSFFKRNNEFQNDSVSLDHCLIISYYLFEHNMLNIKKYGLKPVVVKEVLLKENLIAFRKNPNILLKYKPELTKIIHATKDTVNNNFLSYENKIYKNINSHLDKLPIMGIDQQMIDLEHNVELTKDELETIIEKLNIKC